MFNIRRSGYRLGIQDICQTKPVSRRHRVDSAYLISREGYRPVRFNSGPSTSHVTTSWNRAAFLCVLFGALGIAGGSLIFLTKADELQPETFYTFHLESKEQVSSTSSIFTLSPPLRLARYFNSQNGSSMPWRSSVWSVQIKQPQLQIARAYTPLPTFSTTPTTEKLPKPYALRFLIRRDPKGEVSGYLHKLALGSAVELRGPHVEYQIPDSVDDVLFIAGGTGIAPALQVAYAFYEEQSMIARVPPRLHILWANRRREECLGGVSTSDLSPDTPSLFARSVGRLMFGKSSSQATTTPEDSDPSPLVQDLQLLKRRHSGRFNIDYYVDEEGTFINKHAIASSLRKSHNGTSKAPAGKKIILVSGPDGFVSYLAGPKGWRNGRETQGELSGLLGQLDLQGWEVWKL